MQRQVRKQQRQSLRPLSEHQQRRRQLRQNPRKLSEQFGFEALNLEELLAIILRSGSRTNSVYEIAGNAKPVIIESLRENWNSEKFLSIHRNALPVSPALRASIASLYEFCRRLRITKDIVAETSTPNKVAERFSFLKNKRQEEVYGIYLFPDLKIRKTILLAKGSIDYVTLEPADVFYFAIKHRCRNVILLHNHPSGEFLPSEADVEQTKRLLAAAKLMNIYLLDHIIVAQNGYYSFKESKVVL